MYVPSAFRITDEKIISSFIRDNGFATLISTSDSWPLATHIPLDLKRNSAGANVLWGHVSKANPQWKSFVQNQKVLAIFMSSTHHYISSSWYNHPNAPTWNYISIQVKGIIKLLEGEELWESVRRLTDKYEANSETPVSLDRLPKQVQQQMNGIIGFEIEMVEVDAAFKLSQNRNDEDFQNILHELEKISNPESLQMAEWMRRMRQHR